MSDSEPVGEFDELDAAIADAQAVRVRHRAEEMRIQQAQEDFHRRFRDWAETVAAPTLEAVADHVREHYEYTAMHLHHPDHGAGHRESVDLNVRLMGEYVQLTFRARVPELAVGVSENHGAEVAEPLESLTAEVIRHRAIDLVLQAIARTGEPEATV